MEIGPDTRVECIRDDWWRGGPHEKYVHEVPSLGGIYTVRSVVDANYILLEEIKNPPCPPFSSNRESGFLISFFRPIDDHQTDIEIFREIDRKVFSGEPVEVA